MFIVLLLLVSLLQVGADTFNSRQTVNGISPAIRNYWMRQAMQVQIDTQDTPCPFGPFGAVIVDHSPTRENPAANPNGTLVCVNSGLPFAFSATYHGEITALLSCAQIFQDKYGSPQGRNYSLWNHLTLYTTGEPCPMCAGAIHWQRLRELVWSVPIRYMSQNGRQQIRLPSLVVHEVSEDLQYDIVTEELDFPIDVIRQVAFDDIAVYFAWQYNINKPCPAGCHRDIITLPGDTIPRCIAN